MEIAIGFIVVAAMGGLATWWALTHTGEDEPHKETK